MKSEELGLIYDTVLSSPGMTENVKMDVKVPRKLVLMMAQVCDRTLHETTGDKELLSLFPKDAIAQLLELSADMLEKAGLTALNQKLKAILK